MWLRFRRFYDANEFYILGVFFFICFVWGTFSFMHYPELMRSPVFVDSMYNSLKLFVLDAPDIERMAEDTPGLFYVLRFLSPILLGYTVIKTLIFIARDKLAEIGVGFYSDHVIICSLNHVSLYVIEQLIEKGEVKKIVVLDEDPDKYLVERLKQFNIPLIKGNPSEPDALAVCRLNSARYLLALNDSDERNLNICYSADSLKKRKGKHKLTCLLDIKDNGIYDLLGNHPFLNKHEEHFEVRALSLNENAARTIFNKYSPDLYHDTNSIDADPVHILLVGDTNLVYHQILYYARNAYFLNGKLVSITLLGKDALEVKSKLFQHYPNLDLMLHFEAIAQEPSTFSQQHLTLLNDQKPIHQIILMLSDEESSLNISYNFRRFLRTESLPIITILPEDAIFGKYFEQFPLFYEGDNIHLLNYLELACDINYVVLEKIFDMAKLIHNNYLKLEQEKPNPNQQKLRTWKELPLSMKMANLYQIEHVYVKVRALGLELANPDDNRPKADLSVLDPQTVDALAKAEHSRWNASRWTDGWMVGERDNARKLHPNLVAWEELDQPTKQYDIDVIYNLPELAEMMGYKLVWKEQNIRVGSVKSV